MIMPVLSEGLIQSHLEDARSVSCSFLTGGHEGFLSDFIDAQSQRAFMKVSEK